MSDTQHIVRSKVVMIGAPGVGKTSLVRRLVHSVFSDEYRSTLGVKVDRKLVIIDQVAVTMILWDMHGEGDGLVVPRKYLRGASAALACFDATRPDTLDTARLLLERVREQSPDVLAVAVANKTDLDVDHDQVRSSAESLGAASTHLTSAKTGDGVEDAFMRIASGLCERAGF